MSIAHSAVRRGAALRRLWNGPLAFLVLAVIVFVALPAIASGITVHQDDVYNSLHPFADMGLVAIGLGATMVIGEFDLSVVGSYGLGAMVGVKVGQNSPIAGILAAVGVGALAGLLQGTLIARLRLRSEPVTLGGLLVMMGLTYAIGHGRNVSFVNIDFGIGIDQPVGGIIPLRGVIVLVGCVLAWLVFRYTAVGKLMRAIGGDRKASWSLGLPVRSVLTGTFILSGVFASLGGVMSAYALSSAQANVTFDPLTFGVTAALIGGVALSGGRGSVVGVTAAALGLSLVQGVFQVMALQVYYSNVIMGALLFVVAGTQSQGIRRFLQRQLSRRRRRRRRRRDVLPGQAAAQPVRDTSASEARRLPHHSTQSASAGKR